jgi:hypothetical protein
MKVALVGRESTWYVGYYEYLAYCTSSGWWMMMTTVEQSLEWLAGETEVLKENLPQCHFVPNKSSGCRDEKPTTNSLSYGTTIAALRKWKHKRERDKSGREYLDISERTDRMKRDQNQAEGQRVAQLSKQLLSQTEWCKRSEWNMKHLVTKGRLSGWPCATLAFTKLWKLQFLHPCSFASQQ